MRLGLIKALLQKTYKTQKVMRKFMFAILAVAAIGLTGCSKENDEQQDGIVGKWNAVIDYEKIDNQWEEWYVYDDEEFVLEFFSNGSIKAYEYGKHISSGSYLYDKEKNEITMTVMGSMKVKVEELTEQRLIVYNSDVRIVFDRI